MRGVLNHLNIFTTDNSVIWAFSAWLGFAHEARGVRRLFISWVLQQPGQDAFDRVLYKDMGRISVAVLVFGFSLEAEVRSLLQIGWDGSLLMAGATCLILLVLTGYVYGYEESC